MRLGELVVKSAASSQAEHSKNNESLESKLSLVWGVCFIHLEPEFCSLWDLLRVPHRDDDALSGRSLDFRSHLSGVLELFQGYSCLTKRLEENSADQVTSPKLQKPNTWYHHWLKRSWDTSLNMYLNNPQSPGRCHGDIHCIIRGSQLIPLC